MKAEILKEIEKNSLKYDKENIFPKEDFEMLKKEGYYKYLVPKKLGGLGYSLKEVTHFQTELAEHSPATALAINMHQIIISLANHMVKNGNEKGNIILKLASKDKLFAFAISEPSNDLVLMGSTTTAQKVDNGYLLNGKKVFVSMAKDADYLLTFAQIKDINKLVFGIVKNHSEGIEIIEDWDSLGMRATQSNSINFENLLIENENVLTTIEAGLNFDPVFFGIFSNFEILLASVYYGLGKRILKLTIDQVKNRFSVEKNTTYNNDPLIRHRIADCKIELEGIDAIIDRLCDDLENGIDHGIFWFPKLSTIKNKASEATFKIAQESMRCVGGKAYANSNELSKLYRDSLAGLFQPSDQESLHNAWANMLLGVVEK